MNKPERACFGAAIERSGGVPPAVSGTSRTRFGEVKIHERGRLPHWEKEGGTYFVRFRLADSLPKSVLQKIIAEREDKLRTAQQLKRELSPDEHTKLLRLSTVWAGRPHDSRRYRTRGERAGMSGSRARTPLWVTLTATFFGTGLMRPGPGTWGSAATVLLWYGVSRMLSAGAQPAAAIVLALGAVAIGIPAATRISRATGLDDPQFVVIDEVAGQLITFIFVPVSWKSLLVGFILFRGFDIVKPPPVRWLERLPEGFGIVIDDVGAGLYALAVMQGLLHYGILPR